MEPIIQEPVTPANPPVDVYTMPDKFHSQQAYSSRAPLIIVLSILALVVLISASYFGYDYWLTQQAEIARQQQANQIAQIAPINTEPPVMPEIIEATTTATSTDSMAATSTLATSDVLLGGTASVPQFAADTDADGLSDIEEGTIGSGPSNPDSDGDGYRDGSELANGFNPLVAGSADAAKMSAANFMIKATTDFIDGNFSIMIPKSWRTQTVAATRQLIVTTDSGEIIRVSAKDNPQGLSAANWYLQSHPKAALSELQNVTFGSLSGVVSLSGLDIYLRDMVSQRLFTFEYTLSTGSGTFNYPALFNYLVKSFTISTVTTRPTATSSSPSIDVQ